MHHVFLFEQVKSADGSAEDDGELGYDSDEEGGPESEDLSEEESAGPQRTVNSEEKRV
jgi:hypothetical protein